MNSATTAYDTKNVFDNLLCLLAMQAETLEDYVVAVFASRASELEATIDDLLDAGYITSTVDIKTRKPALRLTGTGKTLAEACKIRFDMIRCGLLS